MFYILFFLWLVLSSLSAGVNPPAYIWNLGLAMTCDVTPFKNGLPDNYQTTPNHFVKPTNYVHKINEGDIVWVQSHRVAFFYYHILPNIQTNFFLYICDGDATFPGTYMNSFDVYSLIDDPRVIHIFSQNSDYARFDGKVSGIPIGIDFHTLTNAFKCSIFFEPQQSVKEQARKLNRLLQTLLPTKQRIKKAFIDFHLADRGVNFGESRTSIFQQICPSPWIDAAPEKMPRHILWETKGKYAFSISPHGAGLDCHRTWEDLVLGCIVIVKTSPLDRLYKGLPVVIVREWSEIDQDNLDRWFNQYGDAFTNPNYRERLTHRYWMNVMRSKQNEYLNRLI